MMSTTPPLDRCGSCGYRTVPGDANDAKIHAGYHRRWGFAANALGREPEFYEDREAAKQKGRALLQLDDLPSRTLGGEYIVLAWFDRSVEVAVRDDYWARHPTPSQFIAMLNLEGEFPPDVAQALRGRYGPRTPGVLDGDSYWRP